MVQRVFLQRVLFQSPLALQLPLVPLAQREPQQVQARALQRQVRLQRQVQVRVLRQVLQREQVRVLRLFQHRLF